MDNCVFNYDLGETPEVPPELLATLGLVVVGGGAWFLGKHFKVATKLANLTDDQCEIPEEPEQKAALFVFAVLKQLAEWRKCVWSDPKFTEGDNNKYIDKWAYKNRIDRFNYNKYAEEVNRLILCITGHMISIANLNAGIPDYIKGKGYCSALVLAFDLMTWRVLEATTSEDSPFFVEDNKMKRSDIKYMKRVISELSGFLEALRENMSNTHDNGKSGIITFVEQNDFITVTPLHKLKQSKVIKTNKDFLYIPTEEGLKYINDIPNMLLESFYKRLQKNLEEPCRLSKQYEKRKEIIKTAKEVKDIVQCFKDAGKTILAAA